MCSWWECPWPGCETKCHSNQCEVLKRQQERRRYQNSKKSQNIPPLTYRQCDKLGELKRKHLPPKEKLSQSHVCDKHKAAVRSQQTKHSTNRIRMKRDWLKTQLWPPVSCQKSLFQRFMATTHQRCSQAIHHRTCRIQDTSQICQDRLQVIL